jgi:hypothetical protein
MAVASDGKRVFLTGSSCTGCLNVDFTTVSYDSIAGVLLWVARYDGPAHRVDEAYAIGASPDGAEVYVTGASMNDDLQRDFATVAYDATTGDQLWEARYAGPGGGNDFGRRIAVDPLGTMVYVTGTGSGSGSGADYATVAYDALTGEEMWVGAYDGPASSTDIPQAVMASPDSQTVYVTGGSIGDQYNDYATVAYDANTGVQEWVARYNSGGTRGDTAAALGVSPDSSRVYVSGCTGDFDYCVNSDWTTIAYDSSGHGIWLKTFDGPAHGQDIVAGLQLSPDGSRVYVAGSSLSLGLFDFAVVAYDSATGQTAWKSRYVGPGGDDIAAGLAMAPDGSEVVVTGFTEDSPHTGAATVAFDSGTGNILWGALQNGEGAVATGFSPDSTMVFVTGSVFRNGYAYDTFAYQA